MISIVDYGVGNVQAFHNVYKRLGIPCRVARSANEIIDSSKIILPGVGAFDHAMRCLHKSGLKEALDEAVIGSKKPVLGVCVGMQMLSCGSEEGKQPGLAWIDGYVRKFQPANLGALPLPHMGWNNLTFKQCDLFKDMRANSRFYFLHSYHFECGDNAAELSKSTYGMEFTSSVRSGNVYGVQFHPEKSHSDGIKLLINFGALS